MKKTLRLTLGIGILVTVLILAAGLFIGTRWVQTRVESLRASASATVEATARGLDTVFAQTALAVDFAAADLSARPRTVDEMTNFVALFYGSLARNCPVVSHVCVGYAPGMLVPGEAHNAFFCRRLSFGDDRTETGRWTDASGFDYFVHSWYLTPAALGRATWTLAHRSNIANARNVVSYTAPFFRGAGSARRLAGVVDVAVNIESLDGLVIPFRPVSFGARLDGAQALVVNAWGTVILSPCLPEKIGLTCFDAIAVSEHPDPADRVALRQVLRSNARSGSISLSRSAILGADSVANELFFHRLRNGWVALIALPTSWHFHLLAPAIIIGVLVLAFLVAMVALAFLAERRRLAAERAAAEGELNAARAIQHDLLPAVLPPLDGFTNVTVAASLDAAKGVGGDLFDVVPVDATHIAFIIGDVSGKGVPASLFMAIVQTLQRSLLRAAGPDPAAVVTSLNRLLAANNRSNMFVTYWIGILDVRTGTLVYTNGGHNPPILRRASGAVEFLRARHGPPLGVIPSARPYRSEQVVMAEGDAIVLYTDGVTEASDRHLRMFTEARLQQTLASRPSEPPAATLAAIKAAVATFIAGAEPFDDLTVLVARYGASGSVKRFKTTSIPSAAAQLQTFLAGIEAIRSLDAKRRNRLLVAAEELFVNVCHYAYGGQPGPFALEVSVQNNRLALVFIDSGVAFNPLSHADPDLSVPAAQRAPGGLGIFLVRKAVDSLSYRRDDGRNILTLALDLGGEPGKKA